MSLLRSLSVSALMLAGLSAIPAVELAITPDRADGLYPPGTAVTWTITAKDQVAPDGLRYQVKSGGLTELATGTLTFAAGVATVSAQLDAAGTLLLDVAHDGKHSYGGAAFAWQDIAVSAPEPADFDAFWTAKLGELAAVPADPQLEPVESGTPGVQLWKITMGNIRGTSIHGYLARPEGDAPCPALLAVQYAGVYPLDRKSSVGPAKNGWMVLNLIAHDLPVDQSKEFYAQQSAGPLKNYPAIGSDDRDTSYFLRMYLSCYRGAEYLATRPDWNQKTLLVQGGSQGGMQAVVTAALHPAVTSVTANVPAGCDLTGATVGRAAGWPKWIWDPKDAKKTTAATYYDVVNFARRVRCPIMVGVGLIDTTCPPAGVLAMCNQITAPKRVVIMPLADHQKDHKAYYGALWGWMNAAKDGKTPPLQ